MAELVDALDSKSGGRKVVRVRFPPRPPLTMKIAIFTDCYLDLTGGIVTSINTEKEELERRGHTVYVFSSAFPRSAAELERLAKEHIYPVPSCRVFGRGATPIARRPHVIEQWLLEKFPEIHDFDIYYIHYEAGCSIAGLRLAHALGIPAIQVMHGREDIGEAKLIPFGFRTFVAFMLNWFHAWYLPHRIKVHRDSFQAKTIASSLMWTLMVNHANSADLVITPSEHFRELLLHYGVKRDVVALHHGVPDHHFGPAVVHNLPPGEPLRILWHSRVSGEKRILPFLEALKGLKSSTYHLDVYGAGPDLLPAKAYARAHRLSVTFHGVANLATIATALKQAHLDVLVSSNYDTFGMILIEAEAFGVPVLIVDPALSEALPEGGYILAADPSPKAIAAAIKELIASPERISVMSRIMLENRHTIKNSLAIDSLEDIFNIQRSNVENHKKLAKKS